MRRSLEVLAGLVMMALALQGCGKKAPAPNQPTDKFIAQHGSHFKGVYHTVVKGDTLYSISKLYNVPVDSLIKANGMADPNRLEIGYLLFIPGAASTKSSGDPGAAQPQPTQPTPLPPRNTNNRGPLAAESSFIWPARGNILAHFGDLIDGKVKLNGIRIASPVGTRIAAAKSGEVSWVSDGMPGFGKMILIKHSDGFTTGYGYCSEIIVRQGDWVQQGEAIALSGQTGTANTPCLYFQVSRGATEADPLQHLPR